LTASSGWPLLASFEEKKAFYDQSPVRLNQFVREQTKWTATEMENRGKQLAQQALRIWPYPKANDA
jgi:hypothetical protein